VPFKKLIGSLTNTDREESIAFSTRDKKRGRLGEINRCTENLDKIVPWRIKCFEQAVVMMIFARILQVPVTVYFGLFKDGGEIAAHAWTKAGDRILSGKKGYKYYTPVFHRSYYP